MILQSFCVDIRCVGLCSYRVGPRVVYGSWSFTHTSHHAGWHGVALPESHRGALAVSRTSGGPRGLQDWAAGSLGRLGYDISLVSKCLAHHDHELWASRCTTSALLGNLRISHLWMGLQGSHLQSSAIWRAHQAYEL